MAKQKKISKTAALIDSAKQIGALWMEFRKCFQIACGNQPITSQNEQMFLQIKSDLSRTQRSLAQRLPAGFKYGSKRMTGIMAQSISIAALRELPVADKKGLYQEWHAAYIALENLRGVLSVMDEGYHIQFEAIQASGGSLKDKMTGSSKKEKKSGTNPLVILFILVLIGGAIWYFTKK